MKALIDHAALLGMETVCVGLPPRGGGSRSHVPSCPSGLHSTAHMLVAFRPFSSRRVSLASATRRRPAVHGAGRPLRSCC